MVWLTDFTLIDFCSKTSGRRAEHWSPSEYIPDEILEPVYMPDSSGKDFYPCDVCGKNNWLFAEYGAEDGFCLNFKNCDYVKNHYRYTRKTYDNPAQKQYSEGEYKKYYDLYMKTDINLLRIIYDVLSLTDETAGDLFDGDRMPIMKDMLNVCSLLGIEPPDLFGIPEEGYVRDIPRSFDCINLIERK